MERLPVGLKDFLMSKLVSKITSLIYKKHIQFSSVLET